MNMLFNNYKQNKVQAQQYRTLGNSVLSGGAVPGNQLGGGATPAGPSAPTLGNVKIQGSDGKIWSIPQANLQAAKLRDPNLQVVQ